MWISSSAQISSSFSQLRFFPFQKRDHLSRLAAAPAVDVGHCLRGDGRNTVASRAAAKPPKREALRAFIMQLIKTSKKHSEESASLIRVSINELRCGWTGNTFVNKVVYQLRSCLCGRSTDRSILKSVKRNEMCVISNDLL